MEDLDEAGNEIMIGDEERIMYAVGEVFLHLDQDEAEAKLAEGAERSAKELKALEEENKGIKEKMSELKKVLYGKFGTAINLETD
eukprot:scaffold1724_cov341-Pavlova_lutheri.AAC.71